MTNHIWHAFYFDGLGGSMPPVRTELIEADSEDDAAKVAKDHLGGCKRVDLSPPRWEEAKIIVIVADDRTSPSRSVH